MSLTTERLRLADASPLVLAVSPLTDFLWPEFVREAKPQVKYISDRFDIRQLSRFGKELFEFFYCAGEVKPLVTLDAVEEYFRAKQNGEKVTHPKGYKPENALWLKIIGDIADHPGYPALQLACTGDHFSSGNHAVCVLNELSNLLEDMLEASATTVDALTTKASELKEIREQFLKAMADKDTQRAAELRQKGKELGQEIESNLDHAHSLYKPEIQNSIEKAVQEAADVESAVSTLAGDQAGIGEKLTDVSDKNELARKLKNNKKLLQFARKLGAIKRAWSDRKRAKKVSSNYSDIVGATLTNDVTRAFPTEIALAGTEEGKLLFALKHSQKTLLTRDYEANLKDVAKGPVVMYVDVSGSMSGERELWSKAMAYVVAEECVKSNREVQVHLFDTGLTQSIELVPGREDNESMLDFILRWTTRGGTSFDQVMRDAYSREIDLRADILIITDGEAEVTDTIVRKFDRFKNERKVDVHAFCISTEGRSLGRFCDTVQLIDTDKDAEASELFQKAID